MAYLIKFFKFLGVNQGEDRSKLNIYSSLNQNIQKNHFLWFSIAIITPIWAVSFISLAFLKDKEVFTYIALIPIGIILAYSRYLIGQGRAVFWKEFALQNGWVYSPKLDLSKEPAILLKQGNSGRWGKYELRKNVDGKQVRIFYYTYKVRVGKHTYTHSYTVIGFTFSGSFPHLFLDRALNTSGVTNVSLVPLGIKIDIPPVPLPSEFEEKFKLYSPQKYEIEALQIFTPDILEHLLNIDFKYDIEFIDQEILIFIDGEIDSLEKLEHEFEAAKKIRDLLAPTLNSIKFSPIGDRPYYLTK